MFHKDRSRNLSQGGFTLTELMLSMAFVAFLLLFVVTSIVQSLRIYNKGVALRHINQSGRQLNEELTRSLRYANAARFDSGLRLSWQRICVNGVTYIWNTEDVAGLNQLNTYSDSTTPIRFIRVDDSTAALCANQTAPISKATARDLISPELTVLRMSAERAPLDPRIVTITSVISTSGDNRPLLNGANPICPPGGNGAFCAFGEFRTTVYIRN